MKQLCNISSLNEFLSVPAIHIQKSQVWAAATPKDGEVAIRRRRALRRVDRELQKGNYKAALSTMKHLQAHPAGLLRGFGAAAPKVCGSVSALDELNLTMETEIQSLQSVVDSILHSVQRSLEFQLQDEETEVLLQDYGKVTDAESYSSIYEDHLMCMQHEAGHFLVGYMLGVLPKRYKVPSVQDLLQDKLARGKVDFLGFEFLRDIGPDTMSNKNFSKGKLNKETLKKFTRVILGGLAAEHLLFGYSELLHSDVEKLDRVLKWLGLNKNEVNCEVRQAAEAAVLILCSYGEAQSRLAEAMALGRSVGFCIETIETTLNFKKRTL
ncbi:hypothetical protein BUALT_Bualt16G0049400 [Buddleja alternifolia]|uniref:ATP-dependent Zn protease n=1 Tax=Buddleja alternifolia TaxID=168488 RepID=A0AAV6WJT6_9LAMI|nr:hypothetical protein BUALT_Bualt16G0049400 [Buddleja alternifolia]